MKSPTMKTISKMLKRKALRRHWKIKKTSQTHGCCRGFWHQTTHEFTESVKIVIWPKGICSFDAICIRIRTTLFFTELEKTVAKRVWKHKSSWVARAGAKQNTNLAGLFTVIYRVTGTKQHDICTETDTGSCYQTEGPEVKPCRLGLLNLTQGTQHRDWMEASAFDDSGQRTHM